MEYKNKRLLISQELFFAKALAGNDKTRRDRALKKLHKWLHARTHDGSTGFSKEDYMRIWKGLFYCFWMSDKPLIQEEVAESISNLVHSVGEGADLFIKCFFLTMIHEWNGIDQHRLDKFEMLVRRCLRQSFVWGQRTGWSESAQALSSVFEETILKPTGTLDGYPIGLILHVSDIYMEELTKAVDRKGRPPESDVVILLVRPFVRLLARNDDPRIAKSITETVFNHLMRQSDVGLDYEELRRKGLHLKNNIEESDEEEDDNEEDDDEGEGDDGAEDEEEGEDEGEEMVLEAKDPRAGGVDVVLPQLDIEFESLSAMMFDEVKDTSLRPKLRRRVEDIARKINSITRGRYPLQIGTVPTDLKWKKEERKRAVKKASLNLLKLEEKFLEKEIEVVAEMEGAEGLLEDFPKKKQKMMNGKLPKAEEEGVSKGRKRKRGKRKSRAERKRAAAKGIVEGSGISKVNSVEKCSVDKEGTFAVEEESPPPPPKKRRSICEGWEVGELKTPDRDVEVMKTPDRSGKTRRSIQSGDWLVQTCENGAVSDKMPRRSSLKTPKVGNNETEVVIKSLRPNPFSPFCHKMITPKHLRNELIKNITPSSDKKVKIVLSRNLSQGTQEYQKSLEASPAIPFDPTKMPAQGVLKATSSPILLNPFYRKSLRAMKLSP